MKNSDSLKFLISATVISAVIFSSCGGGGSASSGALCAGDILLPFQEKKGKDWGFIDIDGNVIIEPEFDNQPTIAENGVAMVINKKNKYEFLRLEGGKAVESDETWERASAFSNGMAMVRNTNEKVSYINEDFEVVFSADHQTVGSFNNGLAAFKNDKGKWGFMGETGETVIDAKYDRVTQNFSALGYAIVESMEKDETHTIIINKGGEEVLNLKDDYSNVQHGSVNSAWFLVQDEDGESGFIDLEGEEVIKMDEKTYLPFYGDYATFQEDNEWGLSDADGNEILKPKYSEPLLAFNDLVTFEDDGEWGIMEVTGEEILDPEYSSIMPFFCGSTFARDKDDFILIDQEGNEIKIETDIENMLSENRYYDVFLSFTDESRMNSDYFDPSEIANLVSLKDFINANTANKALDFVGVGAKSYFLTPGTHNSKGGDFSYDYGTKKYEQELVYRSSQRYSSTLYQYDNTADAAIDEAMSEYEDAMDEMVEDYDEERVPDYAFPEYEDYVAPFGPNNLSSINYSVRCSGAMAETEAKSVNVRRSSIEDLSRNEQNIYLRKKQNAVIKQLGYLKPTETNVTRQELSYELANNKAYYLAKVLGEKMKKLSGSKPAETEEVNDEDSMNYELTIRNKTFKEFRLRCTNSRIAIVLKYKGEAH